MGNLGPGRPVHGSRKIPSPGFLVRISGLWIIVGGVSVLGIYGDVGALMIAPFVIASAVFMHPFWKESDEQAKMMEQVQFSKDGDSPAASSRSSSSSRPSAASWD